MKYLKQLYNWVLSWAETPYGAVALFALAFSEASFFPIPPDPLLIALILGMRSKAYKYAAICSIASVSGALLGYTIGFFLWWTPDGEFTSVASFFFTNIPGFTIPLFYEIQQMFEQYNFWIIFTAGFTPIPFKVFTVSGGAFSVNLPMFLIASLISRGARFYLVTFLIWRYGPRIKLFIDKYFDLLALAFTVLLIGGFVIIKLVL